jgi:LytS/YehU family sensor histidine kinase
MEIEGGQIHFFAENSLGKGTSTEEKQHSGIGLENIKKRLNLLYPAGHELLIDKTDEYFRVNLFIRKNEVLL